MTEWTWPYFTHEQWLKLPLKLRQRWWIETEYGTVKPSEELQAAIKIELKKDDD